jgi:hypothetical protein
VGEYNGGGDHWNLTSCFWEYLNTGNPKDFEVSESRALYFNDLVPVHFEYTGWEDYSFYSAPEDHLATFKDAPHPNHLGQLTVPQTFSGFSWRRNNNPDTGHMPNMQDIEYYLLTGDPATRDCIIDHALFAVISMFYRTYGLYCGWPYSEHQGELVDLEKIFIMPYGPRYAGRPLVVALYAYEITGDDRYFYPCNIYAYALRNYIRQCPMGMLADPYNMGYSSGTEAIWNSNHPGVNPPASYAGSDFQIGIGVRSLYSYWNITGDEEIRDAVVMSGRSYEWRAGKSNDTYTGFTYAGWADFRCDGLRYNDAGLSPSWTSSASEGFQGLIFGYMASRRADMYKVITDGMAAAYTNYYPGGNQFEKKIYNVWEAYYMHDSLDNVAPAAVTDLAATLVQGVGVQLSWIAPGDDGRTGRAAEYQVKYAKAPIVEMVKRWDATSQTGWPDLRDPLPYSGDDLVAKSLAYQLNQEIAFWNADNVKNEPSPQDAGANESMIVYNLASQTGYYFALVSIDDAGNISPLSNVVTLTTGIIQADGDASCVFALQGNSPNPFNPSTRISYSVPNGVKYVSLKIFDTQGRLVRSLIDGKTVPGHRIVTWKGMDGGGKSVASGVYLLKLRADNKVKIKRMMLVQ